MITMAMAPVIIVSARRRIHHEVYFDVRRRTVDAAKVPTGTSLLVCGVVWCEHSTLRTDQIDHDLGNLDPNLPL